MREYAAVAPTFWTRGSGKRLRGDAEAQVVALYLMTSPHTTMVGIFHLGLPTLSHETGLTLEGARKGLERTLQEGLAHWDEDEELVYVPALARYQVGERLGRGKGGKMDHRVTGVKRALAPFEGHRFHDMFLERYGDAYSLWDANDQGASEELERGPRARARVPAPAPVPDPTPAGAREEQSACHEQPLLAVSQRPEYRNFEKSFAGHMPSGDNWLDDETRAFAKNNGLTLSAELADVRDYAKSKAILSSDWNAELRRSMRRHVEQRGARNSQTGPVASADVRDVNDMTGVIRLPKRGGAA